MDNYEGFLHLKRQDATFEGFGPIWMPDDLFDFQKHLTDWAIRRGKAAILADCGLGKTLMQLVWAENVVRKTNRPVLIMTPLAVSPQTVREAKKFGIEAVRSRAGEMPGSARIVVTNYEQLHHFEPKDFGGAVCDESSILKSFNGARRNQITEFLRLLPYRLLCTATAAPNDYVELGSSSEALGQMGHMDMLNRFFRNTQNTSDTRNKWRSQGGPKNQWRFKGHAEKPFWRWVCSWARACRKPSDLGFDDAGFDLPSMDVREHIVEVRSSAAGMLFNLPAAGLREEREERRRTINERCEQAAALAASNGHSSVIWCHLNDEGDLLERLIPDAKQIAGATPDEEKEDIYDAFSSGELRRLIIKPKIGAWGMNWQHCSHVITFATHSYEQYYQSVRRCWRFGQEKPVSVDLIATEGERGVKENLMRKSRDADRMFASLVEHMNEAVKVDTSMKFDEREVMPSWL